MYLQHYEFTKDPFHITPDPRFFYLSPSHKEAYASMIYGLKKRKGFIAVIGEVGLGKTTVVRSFLQQQSNQSHLKTIFLFNPNVSFLGLVRHLYKELEIEPPRTKKRKSDLTSELVKHLHQALIEEYSRGYILVLVIDEAQNMPVETLENLRMLSNLETTQDKLLQIFLVGQPELERKLNQPELRQLKQRLALRCTLKPLNKRETVQYIEHRLKMAGLKEQTVFRRGALRRIYRYTKGNPRTINILCDNALVTGFGYGVSRIGPGIIREVNRDMLGAASRPGKLFWSAAIAVALLLVMVGLWYSPYGDSIKSGLLQLPFISHMRASMASSTGASDTERAKARPVYRQVIQRTGPEGIPYLPGNTESISERGNLNIPLTSNSSKLLGWGDEFGLSASLSWKRETNSSETQNKESQQPSLPFYGDSILPAQLDPNEKVIRDELMDRIEVFRELSPVRQKGLIAMAQHTSIQGLMGFKRMLAALENRDFQKAAREMLHSRWARLAGPYATKLAQIMYTG
ncbi:MAG: AAA family ATPase, partial [Desulfohalobiaceae bacterium]